MINFVLSFEELIDVYEMATMSIKITNRQRGLLKRLYEDADAEQKEFIERNYPLILEKAVNNLQMGEGSKTFEVCMLVGNSESDNGLIKKSIKTIQANHVDEAIQKWAETTKHSGELLQKGENGEGWSYFNFRIQALQVN